MGRARWGIGVGIALLTILPVVSAQALQRIALTFDHFSQNPSAVFFFSFILVFMLFYAIFAAGLTKVKPF